MMSVRNAAAYLVTACQIFLILAFAAPLIESLITPRALEEIVWRWGPWIATRAGEAVVIAAAVAWFSSRARKPASRTRGRLDTGRKGPSNT